MKPKKAWQLVMLMEWEGQFRNIVGIEGHLGSTMTSVSKVKSQLRISAEMQATFSFLMMDGENVM